MRWVVQVLAILYHTHVGFGSLFLLHPSTASSGHREYFGVVKGGEEISRNFLCFSLALGFTLLAVKARRTGWIEVGVEFHE